MSSDLDQLLQKLKTSDLFSPDFPKRKHYTHQEWAVLSEEEKAQAHQPSLIAIQRVEHFSELSDLIYKLGTNQNVEAVPILIKLWTDCALVPVRNAAGYALGQIKTPQAQTALQALIEDADYLSVHLAIESIFEMAPLQAFDRLMIYFQKQQLAQPGGTTIPQQILAFFCPSGFQTKLDGTLIPIWNQSQVLTWMIEDKRWIELCIRFRKDQVLGWSAREAIRYLDPQLVKPMLEQVLSQEVPKKPTYTTKGDFLARYEQGDYIKVWQELRSYEWIEGDLREEALAVSRETMKRVARGVETLAKRLAELHWKSLNGALHTRPNQKMKQAMKKMEQLTKTSLPPSLYAFWEVVGGVDLVWDYHRDQPPPKLILDLALDEMDPLSIEPASFWQFEDWESREAPISPELADPFILHLAPDYLHKINVSGGPPYGVELPCLGADPLFLNEEHQLPFVDYLRLCFRWGGFPKLELYQNRTDVTNFVQKITKGIEPF